MNSTKKIRRLALVTIIVSATGCQSTTGLSSLNLNPFNREASSESAGKIAAVETPSATTESSGAEEAGFTAKLASAGMRARDIVSGAFSFGKTPVPSETGTPQDALSLANTPTQLGPEVYVANGQLWESSGSFDRAMDNYSKALESDPKNGPALGAIARLNDRQNKLDEAVEYFGRAIEVDPSEPSLYNDLGLVLARQEKYDEAVAQIQKAIAIAPANKRFANNLATVHMDAGNSELAMATLEKAHEPAVAHYNMAYLNFKRQQVGEARSELETALKIDPSLEPARNLLDKLGGTQIAQATKDTYNAASAVADGVMNVSAGVQESYQAITQQAAPVTQTLTSGITAGAVPYGPAAPYGPTSDNTVPSIATAPPQATTPPAPTTVVAPAAATPAAAPAPATPAPAAAPPATTPAAPAAAGPAAAPAASGGFSMPPSVGG